MAREYDHLFKLLIIGDSGKYLLSIFNRSSNLDLMEQKKNVFPSLSASSKVYISISISISKKV